MATVALSEKGESSAQFRILVVEDEILIRLSMADDLRNAGFLVIEASNAEEALSVLTATPGISLVVTDIRMPGRLDGLQLAHWIRRYAPSIKVAIASATVEAGMEAFDAVLSKPVLPADLLATVRRLLPSAERYGPNHR
jgi:CheY-like chemotaxis protein